METICPRSFSTVPRGGCCHPSRPACACFLSLYLLYNITREAFVSSALMPSVFAFVCDSKQITARTRVYTHAYNVCICVFSCVLGVVSVYNALSLRVLLSCIATVVGAAIPPGLHRLAAQRWTLVRKEQRCLCNEPPLQRDITS